MSNGRAIVVWAPSLSWRPVREFARVIQLADVDFALGRSGANASVWIVDGANRGTDPQLLNHYSRLLHRPRVAFLVNDPASRVPHDEWTRFTVPVEASEVHHWLGLSPAAVDTAGAGLGSDADAPWRHGRIRLKQWPNLARYGRYGADGGLVAACMKLLQASSDYRTLLADGVRPEGLDALLADTWRSGLLTVDPASSRDGAAAPMDVPARSAAGDPRRTSLFEHIRGRAASR